MLFHCNNRLVGLAAACLIVNGCRTPMRMEERSGEFLGHVKSEWLTDGREMLLTAPFSYVDSVKLEWRAPAGARIDGASIPRVFWSLVGGPFEGKYRDASVVHDYETCIRLRPWRAVHRMFYEAMLTRGEAKARAKLMYFAVYHFGPRWPEATPRTAFTESDAVSMQKYLETNPDVSLEDLEQLSPVRLRALVPAPVSDRVQALGLVPDRVIEPTTQARSCVVESNG
jgi:hypothetical protein